MAENSEKHERVHLFSVSAGTRTAAAIVGSALAELIPLLFAGTGESARIGLYRMVAYSGIGGWFASLIPALMLRRTGASQADEPPRVASGRRPGALAPDTFGNRGLARLWSSAKHPDRILALLCRA